MGAECARGAMYAVVQKNSADICATSRWGLPETYQRNTCPGNVSVRSILVILIETDQPSLALPTLQDAQPWFMGTYA